MMMNVLFAIIVLIYSTNVYAGQEMSKSEAVREVLNTTQEIYRLADKSGQVDQDDVRQQLGMLIVKLSSLDQLATFAVISRNIAYPRNAGDENFDQWFDEAFWISIELIAKNKAKAKYLALQEVKQRIFLDGGDKLRFDYFLQE